MKVELNLVGQCLCMCVSFIVSDHKGSTFFRILSKSIKKMAFDGSIRSSWALFWIDIEWKMNVSSNCDDKHGDFSLIKIEAHYNNNHIDQYAVKIALFNAYNFIWTTNLLFFLYFVETNVVLSLAYTVSCRFVLYYLQNIIEYIVNCVIRHDQTIKGGSSKSLAILNES